MADPVGIKLAPTRLARSLARPSCNLVHEVSSGFDKVVAEIWTTGSVGHAAQQELEKTHLGANVQARLKNHQDVIESIPVGLRGRLQDLLTAIAVPISSETGLPHM